MDREELFTFLQEFGTELEKRFDEHLEVVLIGGAFMILTQESRENTTDIDVLPLNTGAWSNPLTPPSPEARAVLNVIKLMAKRHKLGQDWLNDATYTLNGGLNGYVSLKKSQCTLWAEFGMLRIFVPPTEYILACKIFAGREKDEADTFHLLQKLNITNAQQLQHILNFYINLAWQAQFRVSTTIKKFFP
jgi:hypothetical protein